jgi:nitrite reductase/ring-hydroxylating ferredoxin subunit
MSNRHLAWIRNVKSRLAQHVTAKTAEHTTTSIQYTNVVDTYFSAQRDQVAAAAAPFLVLPSCLLPVSHAVATVDPHTATPLFVHRDAQSHQVRAYVNQCRHRGARLITNSNNKPGSLQFPTTTTLIRGSALVCPYHAFTYDVTTGALKGVPGGTVGFPCLNKEQHGLHKHVDCFETAGGIWLGKKDSDSASSGSGWPSIHAELSCLLPPPSSSTSSQSENDNNLVGYHEWQLDANWQLLVETFLEAYHVNHLHKQTLALVAHPSNVMITDVLDSYSLRMTVPLKNVDTTNPPTLLNDDDDDVHDDEEELESFWSQTTTTYLLFPNTAISLFKRFILFLSIVPTSDGNNKENTNSTQPSCKSHVRAWAVARRNLASGSSSNSNGDDSGNRDAMLALARRDYESVIRGIEEDWECAEGIQSGLMAARANNNKSNTTPTFSHGCFEGNNVAFLHHVGLVSQELLLQDRQKDK